jgi:hypothetical protein
VPLRRERNREISSHKKTQRNPIKGKMNWRNGLKRIKIAIQAVGILLLVTSFFMDFWATHFFIVSTSKDSETGENVKIVKQGPGAYEFPFDATNTEIRKALRDTYRGCDDMTSLKNHLIRALTFVVLIEISFWIPAWIARGFLRPKKR